MFASGEEIGDDVRRLKAIEHVEEVFLVGVHFDQLPFSPAEHPIERHVCEFPVVHVVREIKIKNEVVSDKIL